MQIAEQLKPNPTSIAYEQVATQPEFQFPPLWNEDNANNLSQICIVKNEWKHTSTTQNAPSYREAFANDLSSAFYDFI